MVSLARADAFDIRGTVVRLLLATLLALGASVAAGSGPAVSGVRAAGPIDTCINYQAYTLGTTVWLNDAPRGARDDVLPAGTRDSAALKPAPTLFLGLHPTAARGVRANDSFGGDARVYSEPAHAKSFVLHPDGSWDWEPVDGYFGGDSFQYFLQSSSLYCSNIATVTIPPARNVRLVDDQFTTFRDEPLRISPVCSTPTLVPVAYFFCGILDNDLVPDLSLLPVTPYLSRTAVITDAEASPGVPMKTPNGTATVYEDGRFAYTPDPGFTGTDYLWYRLRKPASSEVISVGGHGIDSLILRRYGRIQVDVIERPTYPATAEDDAFTTAEDTPLTITAASLFGNDTNVGHLLSVNTVNASVMNTIPTAHGSLAVFRASVDPGICGQLCLTVTELRYTPNADYAGPDWFSYTGTKTYNSGEQSTQGWVRLDVTPVEDAPRPAPDARTINEDTAITIDVAANDVDPDWNLDPTSVREHPCLVIAAPCLPLHTQEYHGSWVVNADATITYTPTPGFVGNALFPYEISDTLGNTGGAAVVVQVLSDNVVDDAYAGTEDQALSVPAPGVLANDDPQPGGTPNTATIVTQPAKGVVSLGTTGGFTYTPYGDANGTDTFVYRGLDGDTATVTLAIAAVNDAPRATFRCDQSQLPEGQVCSGGGDLLSRLEGDAITFSGYLTDPEFDAGTLRIDWGDGSVTTRTYPCLDLDCGLSPTPWAGACSIGGCPGGAPLYWSEPHTYADNQAGGYTIAVTLTDSKGAVGTRATVANPANAAPVVTLAPSCDGDLCVGFYSDLEAKEGEPVRVTGRVVDPGADEGGSLTVEWGGLSANFAYLGCDDTTSICPSTVKHAERGCTASTRTAACGYFDFTRTYAAPSPAGGYAIGAWATDDESARGATATTTASVINPPPVATDASVSLDEDGSLEIDLRDYAEDETAPDADLSFEVLTEPASGSLNGTAPAVTYEPDADVFGADSFTFRACDSAGGCDEATVSITIRAINDAPDAEDDAFTTDEDQWFFIDPVDLLANDTDVDNVLDPWVGTSIVDGPAKGTLESGREFYGWNYYPAANATGTDTFTYRACDPVLCATAVVTITITPLPDAPVVDVSGSASVAEGPTARSFTFTVTDPDAGSSFALTGSAPSCGAAGTLVTGSLETGGDGGSFECVFADGPASGDVSVAVEDETGLPGSDLMTVEVTNVAPVVSLTGGGGLIPVGVAAAVWATFTDPGVDTHAAAVDWGDGTTSTLASVVRAGLSASHAYAAPGTYTIAVEVTDSDGDSDTQTTTIRVVDPEEAITEVAEDLVALRDVATGAASKSLQVALDSLVGSNGGTATNGALDALEAGDRVTAINKLVAVAKALASVSTPDVTAQAITVAQTAKAVALLVIGDAAAAAGCNPTSAATCSRGEAKAFATANAALADGDARLARGDELGASNAYLKAALAVAQYLP